MYPALSQRIPVITITMLHSASNPHAVPSGSILFSDVAPSRTSYRRAMMPTSTESRDSFASDTPSDVSFESTEMGHDNHEDEIDEFLDTVSSIVVPSFSNDAIFGSTSPRKRGTSVSSSRSRASLDSVRSSSVGTGSTPLTPASVKERTPVTTINDFKLTPPRPRLMRLASDQASYTASSRKANAPEEASALRSASKATSKSDRGSVVSSTSNRDGLMLAMAQLEQELQRTMVTLSSPLASPVPSFSKASTRSKSGRSRRPSTADGASPAGSLSRKPQPLVSATSPSRLQIPRFDSESWGDSLLREMGAAAPTSARRLSTKGSTTLRPISQLSISSTTSNCSHHQTEDRDSDSVSIPSLVFEGRKSGSSSTSSTVSSTASQSVPQVREFVTGGKGSRPDHYFAPGHTASRFATVNNRSASAKPSFYANKNAARSVPSLSALPPREPLPPLPPMPSAIKSSGDLHVASKPLHLPVNPPRSSSSIVRPRTATTSDIHEIQRKPLPSVPAPIPNPVEPLPASMQTRAKRAMSLRRLFT